jgi:outer membrane cobalamin receptor
MRGRLPEREKKMNQRLTPLTAALSIAFLTPAHAAAADNLDPVIVTATRFS